MDVRLEGGVGRSLKLMLLPGVKVTSMFGSLDAEAARSVDFRLVPLLLRLLPLRRPPLPLLRRRAADDGAEPSFLSVAPNSNTGVRAGVCGAFKESSVAGVVEEDDGADALSAGAFRASTDGGVLGWMFAFPAARPARRW